MPMGIKMMKVTSKNTGMDRMKPARLNPQMAFFSGKAATILSAITEAAPLSLISWPRMVPKPTGRPMLVIMLPKPEEMVDAVVSRSRPPATPMTRQAMTMPMAALSLRTMMQNRIIAIATTRAAINIPGLAISVIPFSHTQKFIWDNGPRNDRTSPPEEAGHLLGDAQNRLPFSSKGRS